MADETPRSQFLSLLQQLRQVIDQMKEMFPRLSFTPDGMLVSSIGAAIANHFYGVEVAAEGGAIAARWNGKVVRIATVGENRPSLSLRNEPEHLLVLRLKDSVDFEEVYNGPGSSVWALIANKPAGRANDQRQVRLSMLRNLMRNIPEEDRIPRLGRSQA